MRDMVKVARRMLGGVRRGTASERIFPGYVSFDEGNRPVWWSDELVRDDGGRVFGAHELEPGRRRDAIVIAERGLAVLGEETVTWLPYGDIVGWDKLSKEPVSRSLVVQRRDGAPLELRFDDGGAFAFVQFLGIAIDQNRRRSSEHP